MVSFGYSPEYEDNIAIAREFLAEYRSLRRNYDQEVVEYQRIKGLWAEEAITFQQVIDKQREVLSLGEDLKALVSRIAAAAASIAARTE